MILLDWLLRLLNISQQPTQIKEEDVTSLVRRLLLKIDSQHFEQLSDDLRFGWSQDQQFMQIFTRIASFLTLKDFKKLNSHFEKEILSKRDTSQLLGLVLYIAVNSDIKKEAIETILEFEENQQRIIMKNIQNIDAKCEQITQLKKVVEKIEGIQQENESLREKIARIEEELHHQESQIQQIQSWNAIFSKENAEYEEQKLSVLKQLDITGLRQFKEICLMNKKENEQLASNFQLLETEKITLTQQNGKLKKQLKYCGETIQKQIQEIEILKGKCKLLNEQYWLIGFKGSDEAIQIPQLPLKDNQNIMNLEDGGEYQKTKLPTDRTECSNRQQDQEQSFEIKNNLHVLLSLQDLEKQHEEKLNQIERLKHVKTNQLSKQRKLDRKIEKIKECHRFFKGLYQNTKVIKA